MAERLSITKHLKPEVEMYDEIVEIPFTPQGGNPDGSDDVIVKIYPLFKPEKVKDLINEISQFLGTCNKEKVSVKDDELDDLLCYYIVRYFTDVKVTSSKKAKTIYNEFKILINTKFYKELMGFFPIESIRQVQERWMDLNEMFAKYQDEIIKMQEEANNLELENKDAIQNAFKNKLAKSEDNEIVQ